MAKSTVQVLQKLLTYVRTLPEVTERLSHGAPTFFIRDKRSFVTVWLDGHHQVDFAHLWCACDTELRAHLIEVQPEFYFVPPYVGHRGWIGARLVPTSDLEELTNLLEYAYRLVAPASLVKLLD